MTELLIVNEFSSGTQFIYNGVDNQGRLYHLEPFPTKLKGWQNRELRQTIHRRAGATGLSGATRPPGNGGKTPGILPVCGPFHYHGQVLLGWEKRDGLSLWSSPYPRNEESLLFQDVLGLISAFQFYHLGGLLVGQPAWERIRRGSGGIFFPDPTVVSGLAKPDCALPQGLTDCHPPEQFRGMAESLAGDLFYLGIIIYWLFAGELPYRLTRGWLTQAIVAGENIPLFCKRPDLHPAIGELIDSMLSVCPDRRPDIETLHEKWLQYAVTPDLGRSSPQEQARQQRLTKTWARQNTLRNIAKEGRTLLTYGKQKGGRGPMILAAGILLAGLIMRSCLVIPYQPPLKTIRDFYQDIASPTAFLPDNPRARDTIIRDYLEERNRRFQAAREIVAKPLVKLSGSRIVSSAATSGLIKVAAEVVAWQWNGTGWQRLQRVEYLVLKKTGSGWRIISRSRENGITSESR